MHSVPLKHMSFFIYTAAYIAIPLASSVKRKLPQK